ncbi:MAG: GNAT family N-acetyltransferase, partial [Deltaproteobacteria bacterium]
MKNHVSSLTVPCRLDYLVPLAAFVQELSRLMDFNEKERSQIDLGVEEAVSNVIKHGLEYNPDESFSLICEASPAALTIRILEKGVPFDPAKAPKYSPEHAGDDISGLGTFLMRASMDIVEYHNLGRAGKETVLIKNIGKKRIDSLVESKELVPDGDVPRVAELPPFTIRSPLPDEAIEISKCAYRSYGYSYVADYIYFPDKIIEYNRSGQMISGIAVTEGGVLMGHAALKLTEKEAKIAEIGVAFVRPEFRKMGLLEKITAFLFKQAAEQELEGIFSQAVTSHVASQRALYSKGGVDCGVALAILQGEISFRVLFVDATKREGLWIWYSP